MNGEQIINMSCISYRNVIVDELRTLLEYTQSEISELEKERNELKSHFTGKKAEDKNILKDILTMHSEFEGGVNRIKDIIEELTCMPTTKVERTARAEELAKGIVEMQKELVKKHLLMQKTMNQKVNYQNLREDAEGRLNKTKESFDEGRFKVTEIENYEHGNMYNKKVRLLNSESSRLRGLINSPKGSIGFDNSVSEYLNNSGKGFSISEASIRLQQEIAENKKIEEEIGAINSKYLSKEAFLRLKREVDEKRKRVEDFQKLLKKADEEVRILATPNSPKMKIMMLDTIVGRKSPFQMIEQLSPRSMKLRNSTLLQDIEASLKRVKSIASPVPKN